MKTKKLKQNNNKQTSNKSLPLNPVTHFDIIARFCEENGDAIIMPKNDIGSHNINKHNLDYWIAKMEANDKAIINPADKIFGLFAKLFATNLRYITFNEFIKQMDAIALETLTIIRKNQDNYFIFHLDNKFNKSNLWTFIIIFKKIYKQIRDLGIDTNRFGFDFSFTDADTFYSKSTSITSLIDSANKNNKKVIVLIPDDMSYSGNQLANHCTHFYNKYGYSGLRNLFSYAVPQVKFEIYYLIGYLSSFAKNIKDMVPMNKAEHIPKLLKATEIIPSFKDILKQYVPLATEKRAYIQLKNMFVNDDEYMAFLDKYFFIEHGGVNCVYFDHKIADRVSIFNSIINYGSYPIISGNDRDASKCSPLPIINNCSATYTDSAVCDTGTAVAGASSIDIDGKYDCYKPFYKTIEYKYNGHVVKNVSQLLG